MLLGCSGWLMADIPDPTIRLSIPGTGTFDLCGQFAVAGDTCSITLMDGEPDTTIGDDGFGHFAVKNVNENGFAIDSISFFFETDNLNQPFSAFTDDFTTVGLVKHPSVCDGDFCSTQTLEVDFSGVQKPGEAGSAFLDAVFCEGEFCPTAIGFVPHSDVFVNAHFASVADPPCCDGIQPGEEAGLAITSDVPEPGSFVLLLGAAGLLAIKRKFKFYRT